MWDHDPRRRHVVVGDADALLSLRRKSDLLDVVVSHMVWNHEDELASLVPQCGDPDWAAAMVADALAQKARMMGERA